MALVLDFAEFIIGRAFARPVGFIRAIIQRRIARAIAAGFVLHENLGDLRMPDRLAGIVRQQILLGDVGDLTHAAEIVLYTEKKNALDSLIIASLHDPAKLQPAAINFATFTTKAINTGLTEDELRNVWNLFEGTMTDIPARITAAVPEAGLLFEIWKSTPLKNLSLTSVGIAIGHANATRVVGLDASLDIWIK